MELTVVILAAGLGQRMHSTLPKVLHRLGGKALLEHVVEKVKQLNAELQPLVIYSHVGEEVQQLLSHLNVKWILQSEQLGTGHALQQALPHIYTRSPVLVLSGDVPLISAETLKKLVTTTPSNAFGIVTCQMTHPSGLGRILRDAQGNICEIIEERDADKNQLAIQEINSGIYLIPIDFLKKYLPTVKNQNKSNEYYLTDLISLAVQQKMIIHSIQPEVWQEVLGVNNCGQLAQLERFYQHSCAEKLMQRGVTFYDPARFDVRGELEVGNDVIIDVNVIIEGRVKIGNNCFIGSNTVLRNVTLADDVVIKPNSVIEGAIIAENCIIGPFTRIRPETRLASNTHIGNFVEIKNSEINTETKINHLSYVGDSEVGKNVNIGAGTITCNYDGINKYRTIIDDDAFIGSNTALVAPVKIGEASTIGAGSTITKDVPPHQLALGRAHQTIIKDWQRPEKKASE